MLLSSYFHMSHLNVRKICYSYYQEILVLPAIHSISSYHLINLTVTEISVLTFHFKNVSRMLKKPSPLLHPFGKKIKVSKEYTVCQDVTKLHQVNFFLQ